MDRVNYKECDTEESRLPIIEVVGVIEQRLVRDIEASVNKSEGGRVSLRVAGKLALAPE